MSRFQRGLPAAFLSVVAVTALLPLVVLVLSALHQPGSFVVGISLPSHPSFGNFAKAWSQAGFASLYRSSAIIAVVVVPVAVIFASWAGYALGTMSFRGRNAMLALLLLGMTLPFEVLVVPLYYSLRSWNLLNTYWAVILPLIGAFMPFGVFWMRAHFSSFPRSLLEAAEMDGASAWRIFWRVLIPNSRASITTLGLLYFLWTWNQFLLALVLIQDPGRRTATTGLSDFQGRYGINVPLLSAATILVIMPVTVIFLVFQRQVIQGFLQGTVKE